MKITLSPVRSNDALVVVKSGSVLTVNGEVFDFTQMNDGDTLPAAAINSAWFTGQIDNVGGELDITMILPLPQNYSQAQAFPAALVDIPDGPVALPQPVPLPEMTEQAISQELEA